MTDSHFTRLAGWAAIVTALTTIGVHYITFQGDTFEDRLSLASNEGYITHKWMIILHCLCVIISMLGMALIKYNEARGLIILGCIGFIVFGVIEITRMFSVLQYLNSLRSEYLSVTDPVVQQSLRLAIDHFQYAGFTLFAVFAFFFTLGNLCYGMVLIKSISKAKWIGVGFLWWALIGSLGMVNEYLQWTLIDAISEVNAKGFQPLFRFVIGIWLLQSGMSVERNQKSTVAPLVKN